MRVVDDKLCIGGLAYGQDYAVTPAGRLSRQRRRQARRRAQGRRWRWAPRPAVDHPAGQGLHPAARHRRRPADHHGQRRQARHLGLSRERARPRPASPATATTRASPAPSRSTESWTLRQWLNGEQRQAASGAAPWTCATSRTSRSPPPSRSARRSRTGSPAPTSSWSGTPPSRRPQTTTTTTTTTTERQDVAGMWVMDTDIALTSFTGRDGLNVFARSLAQRPAAGRASRSCCCRAATSRSARRSPAPTAAPPSRPACCAAAAPPRPPRSW